MSHEFGRERPRRRPSDWNLLEERPSPGNELYVLMAPVTLEITSDMSSYGMEAYNQLIRGKVRLIKRSEKTGKTLPGTVFELHDPSGQLLGDFTINPDGVTEVDG